jgi:hypothetical protein
MSKAFKIKTYKTTVKPVAAFGSETWAMTEMDVKGLGTRDRKILRIYRLVVEQGIWRTRTNHELRELYKDPEIVSDIKKKRLERIGHVVRMVQERTNMKIFKSKLEGGRGGGGGGGGGKI